MNKPISVAVIVGSLRKESFNRSIAIAAMARSPKTMKCRIVDIGNLPHYNEDLDGKPPAEWETFRSEIKKSDAVLFFTPNMPAMQQPEAYISNAGDLVDAKGAVTNDKTDEILRDYMSAFAKWVGTIRDDA